MKIIKMQAYGNDFCLTSFENNVDYKELAKKVLDRRLGVGGLGLIVVKIEPNLEMFIYDSLGNKAMMDSNALLCFSKYIYENNLIRKKAFNVIMANTKYSVEIEDDSYILNMGEANYNNSMLHISDPINSFGRVLRLNSNDSITTYSLYLGDVHTIVLVDDFNSKIIDNVDLIINNSIFKNKTNVHFVKIIDKGNIEIKSFDKFSNYLLSSASGAGASALALNKLKLTFKNINVKFELGSVSVEIKKDKALVKGNSVKVFECEYKEEI
ncbi:MAG: diaminopimelate epimerase [Acholeplasmatales bacterium]|nr:diaminopimelate epimerase [Acholeplasmatales bacterium]